MTSYLIDLPKGVDVATIDFGRLHAALEAASIGLDGVSSVKGDDGPRLKIDAEADPAKTLAGFDWSAMQAVDAPDPVALLTERLATIEAGLHVALIGTDAQKADVAEQMSSVDAAPIAAKP